MLAGLGLGLLWFSLFLVSHVALFHFCAIRQRFSAILRIALVALAGHLLSASAAPRVAPLGALNGAILFCCLFVVYMPFYYTVSASLSVRTLVALERIPRGRLPLADLADRFASLEVVRGRLGTLAANGYLEREGEAYRLTRKGRIVARSFRLVKALWKLGPGG